MLELTVLLGVAWLAACVFGRRDGASAERGLLWEGRAALTQLHRALRPPSPLQCVTLFSPLFLCVCVCVCARVQGSSSDV